MSAHAALWIGTVVFLVVGVLMCSGFGITVHVSSPDESRKAN